MTTKDKPIEKGRYDWEEEDVEIQPLKKKKKYVDEGDDAAAKKISDKMKARILGEK